MVFIVALNVSATSLAQEVMNYAFEELVFNRCNGSCTLTPHIGTPFKLEYKSMIEPVEGGGTANFAEIRLNGKEFTLRDVVVRENLPISFAQCLFFEDHRFQMYKLASYASTKTLFSYYLLRDGDIFHLLTSEPIPELSYDYNNNEGRKMLERFYGDVGIGGYNFTGDLDDEPFYMRHYFRLEGNRLIETEAKELR